MYLVQVMKKFFILNITMIMVLSIFVWNLFYSFWGFIFKFKFLLGPGVLHNKLPMWQKRSNFAPHVQNKRSIPLNLAEVSYLTLRQSGVSLVSLGLVMYHFCTLGNSCVSYLGLRPLKNNIVHEKQRIENKIWKLWNVLRKEELKA